MHSFEVERPEEAIKVSFGLSFFKFSIDISLRSAIMQATSEFIILLEKEMSMNRSSLPSGLSTLKKWKEEKETLRFDVKFQRKSGMWSNFQKSMLVWSILADSYIPPLVFVRCTDGTVDAKGKPVSVYSVLDGLQRLSNMFSFMNNEFELHGSMPSVDIDDEKFELDGCSFSDLPQELQNSINSYKFTIQAIEGATEAELEQLYLNINSGVVLSKIQKAKPKLGSELCDWFADVLSKPFFSQGVVLTTSQARREDDLAMALQSLILLDESYNDWKSLSVSECFDYSVYLRESADKDQKLKHFEAITDYLGVFSEKAKYLRKNNVAVVVALAQHVMSEGIKAEEYKDFLDMFLPNASEEYKENSGAGNVKRAKVEARYEILKEACFRHFGLDSVKNSEVIEEVDPADVSDLVGLVSAANSFVNQKKQDDDADGSGVVPEDVSPSEVDSVDA